MSTPTITSLAPLLARLFAEAEAAQGPPMPDFSDQRWQHLMQSKTEYRTLYHRLKDAWLPVSRDTGKLLYVLARSIGARAIIEFGTSFGISTLHLAAALRDNGGGRLITSEFEPSKVRRAREHLKEGGCDDLVEVRAGDALETLRSGLPEVVDLAFLDGAKALYAEVLDLIEGHLRMGALVIADNVDYSPDYLRRVRDPRGGYVSVPVADDVEVSLRSAPR